MVFATYTYITHVFRNHKNLINIIMNRTYFIMLFFLSLIICKVFFHLQIFVARPRVSQNFEEVYLKFFFIMSILKYKIPFRLIWFYLTKTWNTS